MNLLEEHRKQTENLIRKWSATEQGKMEIAEWLLNEGYYPEPYVVPPVFKISDFKLNKNPKNKNFNKTSSHNKKISFPKTDLIQREFGIIHPKYYHDIVYWLMQDWQKVLNKLFNKNNNIISYSFPIPVSSNSKNGKGQLRGGRMIYEFLEMAEKDLIAESHKYQYLAKVDITNFYNSVYTHTIEWAWLGDRKEALRKEKGKELDNLGAKLDNLFQYSNDRRTNGIPVGPVVSDIIVELILSERDTKISNKIKKENIDYIATRFKDDYRILTHSEKDADRIIKIIIEYLSEFNLQVNEQKTQKLKLPEGLYRPHSLMYQPFSLRKYENKIPFKEFETTLLKSIEIHREYPGTSLLEKFLGELVDNDRNKLIKDRLRIQFYNERIPQKKINKTKKSNIKKTISLLFHIKDISPKTTGKVLGIIECIYHLSLDWLHDYIVNSIRFEIEKAIKKENSYELCWLEYFNQKHDLEINIKSEHDKLVQSKKINTKYENYVLYTHPFLASIRGINPHYKKNSFPDPFCKENHDISMMRNVKDCPNLIDYLDVFMRKNSEPES